MPVQAQETSGISLSPLILELSLEAGKGYDKSIVVTNTSRMTYAVSFEAFDVEIESTSHNISFLPAESKKNTARSLAAWILPGGETSFILVPGEKREFSFTLQVPNGVALEDYYASLNFYYQSEAAAQQNGNVRIRQSLGTLLLVTVGDPVAEQGGRLRPDDYVISEPVLHTQVQDTQVLVNFVNNTLRYANLRPILTLVDDAGDIYYQREGQPKRIFPGEAADVVHAFPNTYLESEKPLTMRYAILERQGNQELYARDIPLPVVGRKMNQLSPAQQAVLLAVLLGGVVVAGGVYWRRRTVATPLIRRRK